MKNNVLLEQINRDYIRKLGEIPREKLLLTKKDYERFYRIPEIDEYRDFYKKVKRTVKNCNSIPHFMKINSSNPTPEITEKDWEIIRKKMCFIALHLTKLCNSNCNICFEEAFTTDEMSLQDIKYILSRIGKNKIVDLFGGEPTVRKDFFKIIKLIKESGNYFNLYTNGLKLENENFVNRLKKSGVKEVYLSFNGFKEEIYEKINGDSNQYRRKLKALINLEKYNIPTLLSVNIVNGINDNQIPEIIRLLKISLQKKGFLKGISFYVATPYGRFDTKINKTLTTLDVIKILEKISFAEISRDYFLEFTRLRINLDKILKKIGLYFPLNGCLSALFKLEDDKIKGVIDLNKIKRINSSIENRKFFGLFKELFGKETLKLIINISNKLKPFKLIDWRSENFFKIDISMINTPAMPSYDETSIISIGMQNGKPVSKGYAQLY